MPGQPTGPVRGNLPGVAAIDINGNRYCLDCASYVLNGQDIIYQTAEGICESTGDADGEDIVEGLISGDIEKLLSGTAVLKNSADTPEIDHWHCSMGHRCENSVSSNKYKHIESNRPVGILLEV